MLRGSQAQAALSWCFNALSGTTVAYGSSAPQRCMGQLALANSTLKAGSSGRQGVSGVVATVFGSTGFLGRYVVSAIGERGGRVVCPHRCDDMDMQHLRPMGDLGNIITLHDFSIRDDDLIRRTISKSNVVINLIGQNVETWNFGFNEVHVNFPAKLARMCAETPGVERFIQVSCLGADTASPSERLASKAAGDAAVQREFPGATLLRCGPFIGVEDRFYNDLALWRYSNYGVPVVDGGLNEVQPVYVPDVALAVHNTLQFEEAKGATYELAGNERMQMKDLAHVICDEMREDVKLRQIPSFFAGPLASARTWLTKRTPLHMLTRDVIITPANVSESTVDKVVKPGAKTFKDLHVVPHKTTSGVAIDHVRYWRKGGYNQGTNVPEQV